MANEVERQEFIFGQAAQITRLEVIAERYRKALELFSCEDSRIEGVPHIRGRCCVARGSPPDLKARTSGPGT